MSDWREYSVFVGHIIEAIKQAQEFLQDLSPEELPSDKRTIYATEWALEIVGDRAGRRPPQIQALDENIPWSNLAGMRDRIIHRYEDVDLSIVWDMVRKVLPPLVTRLRRLQHELE
jgi:uncharacterized protein with HEPN domain